MGNMRWICRVFPEKSGRADGSDLDGTAPR